VYEKNSCQNQIKFITDVYLQIYKILQLFTSSFTEITNIFTNTKVNKNAMLIKTCVD
jgi:hypothetical protein